MRDNSFQINSERELLQTFRLRDQGHVVLSGNIQFPIRAEHYFKWVESSGSRVYLVFKKSDWNSPAGMVFKRDNQASNTVMCDWCHNFGSSTDVAMLSLEISARNTVGILVCSDLSCIEKLDDMASLSGKKFETLAKDLKDRIGRFFENTIVKIRRIN